MQWILKLLLKIENTLCIEFVRPIKLCILLSKMSKYTTFRVIFYFVKKIYRKVIIHI